MPLIVLALRCNPADEVDGSGSTDRELFLAPCLGDVGHEAVCMGASRDRDDKLLDLRRNMPGFMSLLHNPRKFQSQFFFHTISSASI